MDIQILSRFYTEPHAQDLRLQNLQLENQNISPKMIWRKQKKKNRPARIPGQNHGAFLVLYLVVVNVYISKAIETTRKMPPGIMISRNIQPSHRPRHWQGGHKVEKRRTIGVGWGSVQGRPKKEKPIEGKEAKEKK